MRAVKSSHGANEHDFFPFVMCKLKTPDLRQNGVFVTQTRLVKSLLKNTSPSSSLEIVCVHERKDVDPAALSEQNGEKTHNV